MIISKIDAKQKRKIDRLILTIFSKNSLSNLRKEHIDEYTFTERIERQVTLKEKRITLIMSEKTHLGYGEILDILCHQEGEEFTEEDLCSSFYESYEEYISSEKKPKDAKELMEKIEEKIKTKIKKHTIISEIEGIEIDQNQEINLGDLIITSSLENYAKLEFKNLEDHKDKERIRSLSGKTCLIGSKTGTFGSVEEWYKNQAFLITGMIAVEAASSYVRGSTSFGIYPKFNILIEKTASNYLFWNESKENIGIGFKRSPGEKLDLRPERINHIRRDGIFDYAFEVLQKKHKTEIEESITKSIYWFGDAHRDPITTMKFMKIWSSIEGLLCGASTKITEDVSTGIVAVLTFGPYKRLEKKDWKKNKEKAKKLYNLRSKSAHHASHNHVTENELIELEVWSSWIIYNFIIFSKQKINSKEEIRKQIKDVSEAQENEIRKNMEPKTRDCP